MDGRGGALEVRPARVVGHLAAEDDPAAHHLDVRLGQVPRAGRVAQLEPDPLGQVGVADRPRRGLDERWSLARSCAPGTGASRRPTATPAPNTKRRR